MKVLTITKPACPGLPSLSEEHSWQIHTTVTIGIHLHHYYLWESILFWSYSHLNKSTRGVTWSDNITLPFTSEENVKQRHACPTDDNTCHVSLWQHLLPDTIVTGPLISVSFCLVKFRMRHWIKVLFPTFGGPITTTTIGGGSSGVRSTTGMWCFFVFKSWVLFVF